ncbi:MAG: HpcH/HpaI aldolase/citrate lyase family protein [Lautropia sp.]
MKPLRNVAKERLAAGQIAFGIGVRYSRTPEIARIAATLGLHYMFIDMEHSPLDLETVAQICAAGIEADVMPNVRVPANDPVFISRVLDVGALGVVVPHVDTADEARAAVAAAKYHPIGARSGMGAMVHFGYAPLSQREMIAQMNAAVLVSVMIETPTAVDNIEAIAAVDGVDVISVGGNDLTIALGIADEHEHPMLDGIYRRVAAAAKRHGKFVRFGGSYDPALIRRHVALGCQMVQVGHDLSLLMQGARQQIAKLGELPVPGSEVGWGSQS